MRIAMIGTSLFHQGAEYVLAAIARGMVAHGHEVTVILSKYHEDWQREHPDWKPFDLGSGVKMIVLPKHRARGSVFSLRQVIKVGQYDVVICHAAPYADTLGIITYTLRKRPAFIYVEHLGGIGTDMWGNPIEPHFSLMSFISNKLRRRLDAQFAVSQGTADAIAHMTRYPRERIYTVFNPALDDLFRQKVSAMPAHPWLRDNAVPTVIAAGAFTTVKNHVLLLRAWVEVVRKCKARLIIFGDGGLRGEYEKLIEELGIGDSVSLPGFTDNLPAALKCAAGFVVSSTIESFSVVLVEALAAGTPVVSTNCPYGPPEILHGGEYGILVKNNDVNALAEGIFKVLRGEGIMPPQESFMPFTVNAIVNRYECAIADVLSKRRLTNETI